jgi:glycosyltransferase involved in cell wall biosynthesis
MKGNARRTMHGNKVFFIPKNHEYVRKLKWHLEKTGVSVVLLKPFHYSSLTNLLKIIYFRLKGYRIIHVHWLYIFPFRFVMRGFYYFCKGLGIKIIWEMHNILPHGYAENDKGNCRWFYEKVDAIIFHSGHDIRRAKDLLNTDVDKIHTIIPHGNFNGSYENTISRREARRHLNIPDNERALLCFGFIRKNRGYEYLIEAIKDMENTIVVIAGKADDKDVCKKLLAYEEQLPHLRVFVKWIPDEEIQYYFNACDIVVLPYTEITTSGVVPLAYAFSRPVITTNIGGMKDIVNEDTGILVPPGDVAALKSAIREMFKKEFEQMGRNAFRYAETRFSWESSARAIKGLYLSLLEPKDVFEELAT